MIHSRLNTDGMDPSVKAVILAVGGVRRLARLLNISHSSITRWTLIPVKHIFKIEKETGIPREKLRPDIYNRPRL